MWGRLLALERRQTSCFALSWREWHLHPCCCGCGCGRFILAIVLPPCLTIISWLCGFICCGIGPFCRKGAVSCSSDENRSIGWFGGFDGDPLKSPGSPGPPLSPGPRALCCCDGSQKTDMGGPHGIGLPVGRCCGWFHPKRSPIPRETPVAFRPT